MSLPTEQEYNEIVSRIQNAMIYCCEELETIVMGVKAGLSEADATEISSRLQKLSVQVLDRICTNPDNPAPLDLPSANTVSLAVGVDRR